MSIALGTSDTPDTGPSKAVVKFFELYPPDVVDKVFSIKAGYPTSTVRTIAKQTEVLEDHVRWMLAVGREGIEYALQRPVMLHRILAEDDPLEPDQAKLALARRWYLDSHNLMAQSLSIDTEVEGLKDEDRNKRLYRKQNLQRMAALAVDKFLDLTEGRRGLGHEINARAAASASVFQYVSNIDRGEEPIEARAQIQEDKDE